MRRLSLILLPLLLLSCGSSPPAPTMPVSTAVTPPTSVSLFIPETIPAPTPSGMCEMNTECFWQAYQQCATSQSARLSVLLEGPTLVHGNTVTSWRNVSLKYIGDTCNILMLDSVSAVLSNGKVAGGPGIGRECSSMTQNPSGTLHITGCTDGPMPSNDIDVPPHG